MRHGVKTGLGAGLVGALLACGNPPTASQTKHDLNKPVRDGDSWNWRQTSRDEYAKYIAAPSGFDDKMLPVTDPLVVREQAWLDRIDGQLRALHPEQLANTPKP